MNLIYRFRRLVFAQVLLGIVAFCLAERNPGMLLIAGAVAALSWYITEGPTGRPLPRWATNLGAIGAVGWLVVDLVWQGGNVIVAMGHFTMWLQIVLLYSEKSNREYAQVLILSLMQMVGASVLSISMIYGAFLVAYSVLALFTVLVFQLKGCSDLVADANRAASPVNHASRPKAVVGRGYRWHFRALAILIGIVSAGVAIAVFVVTPRRGDPKMAAIKTAEKVGTKTTGFNDVVQLGSTPGDSGSKEPVLNVEITLDGENIGSSDRPFLIRGIALDHYDARNHRWQRSRNLPSEDQTLETESQTLELATLSEQTPTFDAHFTLRQSGHRVLFTLAPVVSFQSDGLSQVRFNPMDQYLATPTVAGAVIYSTRSPVAPPADLQKRYANHLLEDGTLLSRNRRPNAISLEEYAREWPVKTQKLKIQKYTLRILEQYGLTRDPEAKQDPRDGEIAAVLTNYLQTKFTYTLEDPPIGEKDDPVTEFLFNNRAGHCEIFAAGLAAMCRSIGIPARIVTGYLASEYNNIGGYYVVRQSDAHAWTEIDTGATGGWRTFDSTPQEAVREEHRSRRNWLSGLREIYEHLEFIWIRSVVAYDQRTRKEVIGNIATTVREASTDEEGWIGKTIAFFRKLPETWQLDRTSYTIAGIIIAALGIALGSLLRTVMIHRRRMAALQLNALPRARRRGMTRKLRFYLYMLNMLERHGYVRPEWQSPFSFAQELAEANPMRFDPVVSLTELFYEIRFGHRDLDTDRRQRIKSHLKQLENALSQSRKAG